MPHCAWPEHGGKAKTCDAKGKTPIGNNNGSICSNGQGTTCTSQTPIIVSEKLAYAFAATPGNDNTFRFNKNVTNISQAFTLQKFTCFPHPFRLSYVWMELEDFQKEVSFYCYEEIYEKPIP